MLKLRKGLFSKAKKKIKNAQARYKKDYDKKRSQKKVIFIIIITMALKL